MRSKAEYKRGQSQEEPGEMDVSPDDICPLDHAMPETRPTVNPAGMGQGWGSQILLFGP